MATVTPQRRSVPIRAVALESILHAAERAGGDAPYLRAAAGVGARGDNSVWVGVRSLDALWARATAMLGPLFPLDVAAGVTPATFGHLTYLLASSTTVAAALRRLTRYYPVLSRGSTYSVHICGCETIVRADLHGGPRCQAAELFAVAVVAGFMRGQVAAPVIPVAVRLQQARPAPRIAAALGERVGASVEYGAPHAELVLERGLLEERLAGADPGLGEILEGYALDMLDRPLPHDFLAAVREHLDRGDAQSAAQLAKGLGLSERTLRRRLGANGTSYQAELDCARLRAAARILDRGHPVERVAEEMGYADASSFGRAFRRWSGMSPAAYRAGLTTDRVTPDRRSH